MHLMALGRMMKGRRHGGSVRYGGALPCQHLRVKHDDVVVSNKLCSAHQVLEPVVYWEPGYLFRNLSGGGLKGTLLKETRTHQRTLFSCLQVWQEFHKEVQNDARLIPLGKQRDTSLPGRSKSYIYFVGMCHTSTHRLPSPARDPTNKISSDTCASICHCYDNNNSS